MTTYKCDFVLLSIFCWKENNWFSLDLDYTFSENTGKKEKHYALSIMTCNNFYEGENEYLDYE